MHASLLLKMGLQPTDETKKQIIIIIIKMFKNDLGPNCKLTC